MELKEEKPRFSDRLRNLRKRFFGTPHITDSYTSPFGIPSTRDSRQILQSYRNVVYQCITSISEDVSQIENYTMYERRGDLVRKDYPVHPILKLLSRPNPEQSKKELLEATQSFIESVGECFWYFALGEQTRKPKEIWVIKPDRVRIIVKDGEVVGYKVRSGNNPEGEFLHPDEIYHFKLFNPNDPFRGLGPLQAGLMYVQTEEFAAELTRNFLYNNATPSGIISIPGDVSKEAYDKFKRQWRQGVSGVKNAGSIATIRGAEAHFEKVGSSLSDIDLKAIKEITGDSISRMFKVPKALLGDFDSAGLGRAGLDTLEYIYMKRTIDPKLTRVDQALQQLAKRFYNDDVVIKHESVVPEDKEFTLKRHEAAVRNWLSVDEVREAEGEPRIGDNKLYVNFNQSPVEDVDTDTKKRYKISIKKDAEPEPEPEPKGFDVKDKSENSPQEIFRRNTVEVSTIQHARKIKREMGKFLKEQESKVLERFQLKSLAKALQDGFDIEEETVEMTALLIPIVIALTLDVGKQSVQFVGGTTYAISAAHERAIREHVLRMSRNYNEEITRKLSETLAQGMKNNETVKELRRRVGREYKEFRGWQAERVARTEAHWAATKATEDAYVQNGVKGKQWYANPGACQYCDAMDGTITSTSQPFLEQGTPVKGVEGGVLSTDYETIESAHLHPNCRCQLLPITNYEASAPRPLATSSDLMKNELSEDMKKRITSYGYKIEEKIEKELGGRLDKKLDKKVKNLDGLIKRLDEVLREEEDNKSEA